MHLIKWKKIKNFNLLDKVDNDYLNKKYQLRPFQKEGVQFLRFSFHSILALPTGLGKTFTSLSAYTYLKTRFNKHGKDLKLIYVSEKSILPQTNYEDLPKFFYGLSSVMIFENTKTQRDKLYDEFVEEQRDILFLNYHTLRNDFDIIKQMVKFIEKEQGNKIIFIYDEADNLSGETSQIHKVAKDLSNMSYRAWALTATPTKGNLEHIFNIFRAIGVKVISKAQFRKDYCITEKNYIASIKYQGNKVGVVFGQPTKNIGVIFRGSFRKLLYIAKYYHRIELLGVPTHGSLKFFNKNKMTFQFILPLKFVGKSTISLRLYNDKEKTKKDIYLDISMFPSESIIGYKNIDKFKETFRDYIIVKSKKEVAKDIPPFTRHKLSLIEDKVTFLAIQKYYIEEDRYNYTKINIALTTPQLLDESIDYYYINEKVKELIRLIYKFKEADEKAIIFNPYSSSLVRVIEILVKEGYLKENEFSVIYGDTEDRDEEKQRYLNDKECRFLFITTAGGKGLNLQVTSHLVFLTLPIDAGMLIQLAGRLARLGLTVKHLNLWFLLQNNTYDIDMYNLVFNQIAFIHKYNPDLLDEGLFDEAYEKNFVKIENDKDRDKFLKKSLSNRKARYLGKYKKGI